MRYHKIIGLLFLIAATGTGYAQKKNTFTVTAYYLGPPERVDSFAVEKLTHIIYSFCYLKDNRLHVPTAADSATITKLVALKKRNPALKVLLSLGGWGGCNTCSAVFATAENRLAFAASVKETGNYFNTDGIDIDWEFPALESSPGQSYSPDDKHNFTLLIEQLRQTLGPKKEISFAAGGFKWALKASTEWAPVMKLVDRVNLMTYDFMPGTSSNHTALYSSSRQSTSADGLTKYLLSIGVPANKIVIGAAFYARVFDSVAAAGNGQYHTAVPAGVVKFRDLDVLLPAGEGYTRYWDDTAHAPFIYNAAKQRFASYDNERSVKDKTGYVIANKLNGIMFWQLSFDKYNGGLLDIIDKGKKGK